MKFDFTLGMNELENAIKLGFFSGPDSEEARLAREGGQKADLNFGF